MQEEIQASHPPADAKIWILILYSKTIKAAYTSHPPGEM